MRGVASNDHRPDRSSSNAALASLTGLIPAGSEEVSMQAAMAFATEGPQMLASNAAAQTEPMNAGLADEAAAKTMVFGAAARAAQQMAARSAACLGGLAGARSVTVPGLSGAAAAAPLLANFAETTIGTGAAGAGGAAGALGNAANVGSAALGAGSAPLGALQGRQSGSSTTKRTATPRVTTTSYPARAVCHRRPGRPE